MKPLIIIIGIIAMTILVTLIVAKNEIDVFHVTFEDGSGRTFTQTERYIWYNGSK